MKLAPLSFLLALLSSCGAATHIVSSSGPARVHVNTGAPVRLVVLRRGEQRTFRPGALRPGDVFTCTLAGQLLHLRVPNRPVGASWSSGTAASTMPGVSNGGPLVLQSKLDGSVVASCGRTPS